jgi:hypothetical protein
VDESEIAKLKLGTCAWSYDDWAGTFYPEHLPAAQRLEFYARYFSGIEVDSTFYHPPAEHVARHWAEVTPEGFTFALKLTREITHERKLRDCFGVARRIRRRLSGARRQARLRARAVASLFHVARGRARLARIRYPAAAHRSLGHRIPARPTGTSRVIVHLLEEHGVCWVWPDVTSLEHQAEAAFDFLPRTPISSTCDCSATSKTNTTPTDIAYTITASCSGRGMRVLKTGSFGCSKRSAT